MRISVSIVAAIGLGVSLILTSPVGAADLNNGKKVYEMRCSGCHGKTGKEDGVKAETMGKKPTDYTDQKKMSEVTDAELKTITREGKPPMPAYAKISDKDLDDVIAYIRTFAK